MKTMNATLTMSRLQLTRASLTSAMQKSFGEKDPQSFSSMSEDDLRNYMQTDDADYIYIPVRMLSATGVQNNTINFGHNNGQALQNAVPLFEGLTILKDHVFSVDNWIGKTQECFWDTQTEGAPPGVTGVMKIDAKADPKCARGLATGALDSVSVTVAFEFEQSHPNMKENEFYRKLGEVVEGKVVQALVTRITRLYELSVVWQGGDKFAKTIDGNGNIVTPGVSNSQSFQEEPVKFAALIAKFGLDIQDPSTATEEQVTSALEAKLALGVTQLTEAQAQVTTLTASMTTLQESQTALTAQVAELETAKTELTTQVEALTSQAALGTQFLSNTRSEALRLYNVVEGDKATEALRQLISTSSLEVAQSFVTSYAPKAEAIAPLHCTKCGSAELSRKQSHTNASSANTTRLKADPRIATALQSMHS